MAIFLYLRDLREIMKLEESFYLGKDVVKIARELLGKGLFVRFGNDVIGGMIVETEAYSHAERGCHAYGRKRTSRNEAMFKSGGHAYVYLCYGIHNMFNVVTNGQDEPEAVLIRALQPIKGIECMKRNMNTQHERRITSGPGKLAKALGIDRTHNANQLWSSHIWIEDIGVSLTRNQIAASPRIGIDYAGEDALLPWRFTIKGNEWVSK